MPKVTVCALLPPPRRDRGLILAVALLCVTGGLAQGVEFGPEPIDLTIAGVAVAIPARAAIDISTDKDAVHAKVDASGDLTNMQAKALAIVRALPLPEDNCARQGPNLVVNSVDAATITATGDTAVIDVSGHVTVWGCGRVFGAVVKTTITSDTIKLLIPVRLKVLGSHDIGLELAQAPQVTTGKTVTFEAANALFGNVDAKLAAALTSLLASNTIKADVSELKGLTFTVKQAEFVASGPALGVHVTGDIDATGATLNAIYEKWGKR